MPKSGERGLEIIALIALLVGAIQLGLGLARLGVLVNFISKPVVNGFMSAAALIIGVSQVGLLLGTDVTGGGFFPTLASAVSQVSSAHLGTVLTGTGCVVLLVAGRYLAPRWPVPFILVVFTTTVTWLFSLHDGGLAIVGTVPAGFPMPAVPEIPSLALLIDVAPYAVGIAFVGFLESISVSRTYAFKQRYEIDANQELRAIGLANAVAAMFGSLVVTGNISRTVVADRQVCARLWPGS